jgi:hypothetical protein
MHAIKASIEVGQRGPEVANLQDGLRLLLERQVIRAADASNSPTAEELSDLATRLGQEQTESSYGDATRRLVQIVQLQQGIGNNLAGAVDKTTAAVLNQLLQKQGAFDDGTPLSVRGQVTMPAGAAAAGYTVRAFDRDLRREQQLGADAVTDTDGHYEIGYSAAQFAAADGGSGADLVVRVFASAGQRGRMLAESATMFNAPPDAEVNLQLLDAAAQPSEYERHVDAIVPRLAGQADDGTALPLGALEDADVSFLAADTGIDRQHIAWLATAFAYSARTAPPDRAMGAAQAEGRVPAALFYGWFRKGLPADWENLTGQSTGALRAAALAAIQDNIIPATLAGAVEQGLGSMPNPARDALLGAVTAAGLGGDAAGVVLRRAGSVTEMTNGLLAKLVSDGQLTVADAHLAGLGLAAHAIVDGDEAAVAALVGTAPARLGDRAPRRARDLAALDAPDIEQAFGDAGVVPPAGQTAAEYTADVAGRIAAMFPADVLLHRAVTVTDDVVSAVRDAVGEGGDGPRPKAPPLQAFINLHPGLGLGSVIDQAADAGAAEAAVRERVGWVDSVHDLNPDLNLLSVDYLPDSQSVGQVNFAGLPDEARAMVIADLKAYQRVQAIGTGAIDGTALLKAGIGSATALALRAPADLAAQTGIPLDQVQAYVHQAEGKADHAALIWFTLHGLERDAQATKVPVFLRPPEYLKKLVGYDELFGSAGFCDCENCQSVLGPAAYFVDLMYWVERHILSGSFAAVGGEANDLHLRGRRPGLWTLDLTCDNTNGVVPTLDLVIAMLEEFIVREKRLASADALYDLLSTVDYSVRLPFSLPAERLSIFLSHLGITRAQIADTFLLRPEDADSRAQARLGLLQKEFAIITTSRLGDLSSDAIRTAEKFFSSWLGVSLTPPVIAGEVETRPLDPVDITVFATAAGLDIGVVSDVLTSGFVNVAAPGAPARIQPESGIRAPGGVQDDTELVPDMTLGRLDRFERLVRLWRHVPWTLPELDYVLGALQRSAHSAPDELGGAEVVGLGQLLELQDRLRLSVEALCALWDTVPRRPLRDDASLFDRAFNQPSFTREGGPWPAEHTAFGDSAAERARLVAATQLSDADLTLLLTGLSGCLTGGESFALDERSLSLIYRYALLSRALDLPVDDLLGTVALTASITAKHETADRCVLTLDDLRAVLAVHDWRTASGFSLQEVSFITGTSDTLDGYPAPGDIAAQLTAEITAEKLLEISQDLFTQIGLTQAQSAAVIAGNSPPAGPTPALFERVPGTEAWRVASTVGLADVAAMLVFDPSLAPDMTASFARDLYAIVRRAGGGGFEPAELAVLGLTEAEAAQFVQASVSSGVADGRPFEQVPGAANRYRRRAAVTEDTAIAAFGTGQQDIAAVKSALRHRAVDLVTRHHAVPVLAAKASAAVKVSPDKALALLTLVMPAAAQEAAELVDAVQGGPLQPLSAVLSALMRNAVLFRDAAYDAAALAFIGATPGPWSWSAAPAAETVRCVALYARLAAAPDPGFQPDAPAPDADALRSVLAEPGSIATAAGTQAGLAQLARALNSDAATVGSVLSQLALAAGAATAPRLDELAQLVGALALTARLGVTAELLRLAVADSTSELARAADGVYAAVRAKYPDEATFTAKLEPFTDKLRSRNRDGLVEYLLTAPDDGFTSWRRRFATASDLYYYFLADVLVEGCARTSKVVAATMSVQLYVQRVLMNLEHSDEDPPRVTARLDDPQLRSEWAWRKNYQVWVANRKVFLFPENYLEPGLRDDKTPLFKELEDVLLQQQVTEQNVLDAYADYLHGFDEVARLRVAGVFHDRPDGGGDVLHLFGVTASEPPVYYYRTISALEPPAATPAKPSKPVFSSWAKLDIQIPARRISPIVLHGRLYIFWVETTTRQKTDFVNGASTFSGYRHSVRTKFSYPRLDGRWTPPQVLKVTDSKGDVLDIRVVEDYLEPGDDKALDYNAQVMLYTGLPPGKAVDGDVFDKNESLIAQLNFRSYWDQDHHEQNDLRTFINFHPNDAKDFTYKLLQRAQWDDLGRDHTVPIETYVPGGWQWERVYPSVVGSGDDARIALEFAPRTGNVSPVPESVDFWSALATPDPAIAEAGLSQFLVIAQDDIGPVGSTAADLYLAMFPPAPAAEPLPFFIATKWINEPIDTASGNISATGPYVHVPPRSTLQVVNGNTGSAVLEPPGESLLLLATSDAPTFELRNLGTSLAQPMGTALTSSGIDGLLSTAFQESKAMEEKPSAAAALGSVTTRGLSTQAAPAAWTGPEAALGGYFREIFFHIPFLIADHLSSQQSFSDAQRWYHYLFDPAASEPGAAETVRPWRYRGFRDQGIASLRDALTDADALHAYQADPANPDAIARLRPGAYQKAVFLKYVDNLLDWGDSLFAQFTMESVNEATMLYVMAADLLGPRPVQLGPCGESSATPKTYAGIAPLLRPASPGDPDTKDFLIEEIETFTITPVPPHLGGQYVFTLPPKLTLTPQPHPMGAEALVAGAGGAGDPAGPSYPAGWNTPGATTWREQAGTPLAELTAGRPVGGAAAPVTGGQAAAFTLSEQPLAVPVPPVSDNIADILNLPSGAPKGLARDDYLRSVKYSPGQAPPASSAAPGGAPAQPKPFELRQSRLVFCLPANQELLGYWDRVEDRLYKVRNCMDIAGVRRQLELFAPEIDPHLLVRMRAAGLTLDDVMNVTSGNLPPYRFAYLIDKAKQHAALVQGFGTQLQIALQQRDSAELEQLRAVHEQNLLTLRSQIMQAEIDAAEDTLESLNRQQAAAEYRRDYFAALSSTGLNPWERTQQVTTHVAGGSLEAASIIQLLSVGLELLPNLGAPTAMKFGGSQVGNSAFFAAGVLKMIAEAAELAGKSAGIEATFQRRDEEWKHQVELAKRDLDQLAKQITAAEIRRDIAVQSQVVHERSLEQAQEVYDFLRDRFTSFGLYTWLSAELQKLHRTAFNGALSLARLAEQACQFEHPDGPAGPALTGDYWDAGHAGLLAGDRLLLDLHNLERGYIETNYRTLEIEQSFSLARFAPDALSKLKTDCSCDFEIPEWFFDLTYPNHYRRRIKAVRLTIPSVVGPYTNVGATLRLTDSHIRAQADLGSPRVPVPLRHTTAIAASTAQSDAGVFEFNFRDERYMPFEGAGVNSNWTLSLPKLVRPFDYSTISDVILRISYTALEDETGVLETAQGAEAGTGVLSTLTGQGVTRILSLRNDFPEAWNALVQGALPATVDIGEIHVPFFMSAFDLDQMSFDLLIEKLEEQHPSYPVVTFDGPTTDSGLDTKTDLYLLGRSASLDFTGKHLLNITSWGTVATDGPQGGPTRLDDTKVKDILLRTVLKRNDPARAG